MTEQRTPLALAAAGVLGVGIIAASPASAGTLSHVTDSVVQNGSAWEYRFTVYNDDRIPNGGDGEHLIIDWELPYFMDMGITDITAPDGWSWYIETIGVENEYRAWDGVAAWQDPADPWYQALDGANNPVFGATQVLHWYCDGNPRQRIDGGEGVWCYNGQSFGSAIEPGGFLSGFGFTAAYGPVDAPYQTSWISQPVNTGDPAFPGGVTVGSPNAGGPGRTRGAVNVPEPGSLALLSLGLLGLAGSGLQRRKGRGGE